MFSDDSAFRYLVVFMKRIGILYHPMKEDSYVLARKLAGFLELNNLSPWLCSAWESDTVREQVDGTDLVLSVGGDGTILRAAQAVIPQPVPITGINLGRLGFMTDLSVDEVEERLPALLAGEGWIDQRSLLEVNITIQDEEQESTGTFYALNDAVVARGAVARLIYLEACIDDQPLTAYKADGVIIATATGSTGYALAVGGPILHPQAEEVLLLPIAPHLSSPYVMVLPAAVIVKLKLITTHPATLGVDGHINVPLPDGAIVTVRRSANTVRFLRSYREISFYSSLEQKLRGKQ